MKCLCFYIILIQKYLCKVPFWSQTQHWVCLSGFLENAIECKKKGEKQEKSFFVVFYFQINILKQISFFLLKAWKQRAILLTARCTL